ncbi:hypothetical protein LTS18_006417 [Coniosporium uncinatum]|uniref:Uncharacterized protein n=1 Tax=Coniosporium uncinatum TaxID=93489 RepID=A0ACC3DQK7_9PEZI|nr:hypothetical protein LTS18_006417 [Coniosporium uncinatum]
MTASEEPTIYVNITTTIQLMQSASSATAVVANGTGAATAVPSPTAMAPTAPDNFTLVALVVLLSLAITVAVVYGIVHLCRHIRRQRATLIAEMRSEQTPSDPGRLHSAPIQVSQSQAVYQRPTEDPIVSHVRRYDVTPTAPLARPESVHLQDRNDYDHSDSVGTVLHSRDNGPQATTRSPTQPWPRSHFSVSSGSFGEVPSGWVSVDTPARTRHQAFDDAFDELPSTGMNRRSVPNMESSRAGVYMNPHRSLGL